MRLLLLPALTACGGPVLSVDITAPDEGAEVRSGEPFGPTATVISEYPMDSLRFSWSADPGGSVGGDLSFDLDTVTLLSNDRLPVGVVALTLTVADPGHVASDTIEIMVTANHPPSVAFAAPADRTDVAEGIPLVIAVRCADADETTLDRLTLAWTGVDSGDATCSAEGDATATIAAVSDANDTLTVTATDPSGQTGGARVTLDVFDADLDDDGHPDAADGGDDCDDAAADVFPGAPEACDGVDQDCDGIIDDDAIGSQWPDADGDGHGDPDGAPSCDGVQSSDDCDDANRYTYAGAAEVCDGRDNDCDGGVDEDVTGIPAWYADLDGDGDGDPATAELTCDPAEGWVLEGGDCDDADPGVYAGAEERCDGADEDCDGSVDEAGATGESLWYRDADGDGHGVVSATTWACDRPSGWAASTDDCDDADGDAFPGAVEACESGADEDCDGDDPACRLAGGSSLSGADAKRLGIATGDGVGALDWAGDVDGDGYDDALLGAWGRSSGTGAAYLLAGPFAGTQTLVTATATFTGASAADSAGYAVAGAGDVNADGYADLLVGAPGADGGGSSSGAAYLLLGPVTSGGLGAADAIYTGEDVSDFAGLAVDGAGDVDGDGDDEVLIGAYGDDAGGSLAGAAYLVSGTGSADLSAVTAKIVGVDADDSAGYAVAGAGDVNGDGRADVLVGAYRADGKGAAYLVYGPITGTVDLSAADATITGQATDDSAGSSVAGAGDTDGDGRDDILVGAYQNDAAAVSAGAAYLFLGPVSGAASVTTADATLQGETADDRAGWALGGGGDADGDGRSDVVIGAYYEGTAGTGAGAGYLLYGPISGVSSLSAADAKWTGESARDAAGHAVAIGGDGDGDGFDDLLFGAPSEASAGAGAGAVYLVLGGGG